MSKPTKNTPPLVRGGQSRSGESLTLPAFVVALCLIAAIAYLIGVIIAQ